MICCKRRLNAPSWASLISACFDQASLSIGLYELLAGATDEQEPHRLDEVLKKFYYKNALKIIPGIEASRFPE